MVGEVLTHDRLRPPYSPLRTSASSADAQRLRREPHDLGKVRSFLGSYDQESYGQAQRRGQVGGNRQATVICRKFQGIDASMQLVCHSRNGDIMKISSVVEQDGDLVITVEEAVA